MTSRSYLCLPLSLVLWHWQALSTIIGLSSSGILLIMWRNIGTPAAMTPSSFSESENDIHRHKKKNSVTVDCSGANRGLFFGIFTLVGIIISMIVFFVLINKPGLKDSAVIVTHSSEIVVYFLAALAVLIAAIRVRHLKFHRDRDNALEELLLVISLAGVYVFALFNVVAGKWYSTSELRGPLVIASNLLVIFQATAQTVFIMNGLRRSALSTIHERRKPGREFVTFLLVCNVAMWGMNTFEVLRASANPVSDTFYGHLAWNIVTHITTPLTIFYRFHSVVCLATIWRSAYKLKLHWISKIGGDSHNFCEVKILTRKLLYAGWVQFWSQLYAGWVQFWSQL